jgi:hypothetical protein
MKLTASMMLTLDGVYPTERSGDPRQRGRVTR